MSIIDEGEAAYSLPSQADSLRSNYSGCDGKQRFKGYCARSFVSKGYSRKGYGLPHRNAS